MWYIEASFKDTYSITNYFHKNVNVRGKLYTIFGLLLAPLNITKATCCHMFFKWVFFPELPNPKNFDSHQIIQVQCRKEKGRFPHNCVSPYAT